MMLRIGSKNTRKTQDVRRKIRVDGFTLIEVLMAVSILSLGLVGVLGAYAKAVDVLGRGQDIVDSVGLLKEKMTELQQQAIVDGGLSVSTSSGVFEAPFETFKWDVKVSSLTDDETNGRLNEITVTVYNEGVTPSRRTSVVSYVENKKEK